MIAAWGNGAEFLERLINSIEAGMPPDEIGPHAQQLAVFLGGKGDLRTMTPGAAALYLFALYARNELRHD